MTQKSDNIEAKLAAYIDGELDEAGRQEIEQYLLTNPGHRRLLTELGKTHALLADLPQEQAPPEIMEEYNSQLERAALLGDAQDIESRTVHRINRRPQLFSLAAILALTVGLGIVVYFVLLPTGPQPYTIATDQTPLTRNGPTSRPVGDDTASPALASEGQVNNHTAGNRAEAPAPVNASSASVLRQTRSMDAARLGPSAGVADSQWQQKDQQLVVQRIQQQLGTVHINTATPVFAAIVQTNDRSATQDQILSFLSVNGIEFEPVAMSQPQLDEGADRENNKENAQNTDNSGVTDHPGADRTGLILARHMSVEQASTLSRALPGWREGQQVSLFRVVMNSPPAQRHESPPAVTEDATTRPLEVDDRQSSAAAKHLVAAAEEESTVGTLEAIDAIPDAIAPAVAPSREQQSDEPQSDKLQGEAQPQDAADIKPEPAQEAQADQLAMSQAQVQTPASQPAAEQATESPDAAGEQLQRPQDNASLSELRFKQDAALSATIAPGDWLRIDVRPADGDARVYMVQVAEDGTINLPVIGAAAAQGFTFAQVGAQLSDSYRRHGLIMSQAVKVQAADATTVANRQPASSSGQDRVDLLIYVWADTPAPASDAAGQGDVIPGQAPAAGRVETEQNPPSDAPGTPDASNPVSADQKETAPAAGEH